MKVLHVITSLKTGGAERLVTDSIPLYQAKGIDTDVVILQDEKTSFRNELEKKTSGKLVFLTKGSVYNPLLIFRLIPLLKQYDVVHAHLFPVLYWVVLAKWLGRSDTPIIYTEHSTNNGRRNNPFLKYIERFIYSKLSAIGCISKGTKDELLNHLNKDLNVRKINNGIDLLRFKNVSAMDREQYIDFEKDAKILIQVSSFREQKDQKTLITALINLPYPIKLLLVGDGPLKNELIDYTQKLKLENRVIFLGNREDIPELLKISDIVILSSKVEGFGLAIVEGMAAGKPVIASNIIGVSEIVDNYGLLFEQGNVKDLSDKIMLLYNSDTYYNEIKDRCIIRASDFSIEKMVDSYIEIYRNYEK
ncbi:glycosyltransferase [Chryseobacterium pennipullorum]|uniref:Glycosyltransferase n=1 Tax=Chryseobacterium pennipullorum TaxID=2258963 RepID=A0A3D9B8M3_9FLAO|nr:glycosyltransferase [Chryseobacterium pennipullorum]REC49606.1 glycosyltransferase [Chryseobacterium pennipullorum]